MHIHQIKEAIAGFTGRRDSLFQTDYIHNRSILEENLSGRKVLVIGGSGSIGSAYIKEILRFPIAEIVIVDHNENGLAELIRDIRSEEWEYLPDIMTYPVNFGSKLFRGILQDHSPFHIVANFAAHKHVRSEKDIHAVKAMFENNFMFNYELLEWFSRNPPEHFFCVSTDKATEPVNIMGASKRLMEDLLMAFQEEFKISTSRFANVAFSNGSLLQSYIHRYERSQPLVCPMDIKRYFVSSDEAGQLCLLSNILGGSGEIFVPKMDESDLIPFPNTIRSFLKVQGLDDAPMYSEDEAREACRHLEEYIDRKQYPVYYFKSDTTGEKLTEQFYSDGDRVDGGRFENINVLPPRSVRLDDMKQAYSAGKSMMEDACEKSDFVRFMEEWVVDFAHDEKGKYLDDKM